MAITRLEREATTELTMQLDGVPNTMDFPEKTWREQMALRRLAMKRDRSIAWLGRLCFGLTMLCFPLFRWVFDLATASTDRWPLFASFSACAVLVTYIFEAIVIAPRIHRALDSEAKAAT